MNAVRRQFQVAVEYVRLIQQIVKSVSQPIKPQLVGCQCLLRLAEICQQQQALALTLAHEPQQVLIPGGHQFQLVP